MQFLMTDTTVCNSVGGLLEYCTMIRSPVVLTEHIFACSHTINNESLMKPLGIVSELHRHTPSTHDRI